MADIDLERIDLVRERTGAGYREAFEALQAEDGDVVRAIVRIEERDGGSAWRGRLQTGGDRAMRRLRRLWRAGNEMRVVVRQGDRRLLDVPASVGVAGALLAPLLTAAGLVAALASHSSLTVESRPDPEEGPR